jgi:hypothetical protein
MQKARQTCTAGSLMQNKNKANINKLLTFLIANF